MKKRGVGVFILILFLIAGIGLIVANSYNVSPPTAGNGTTISILVFNVSNLGTTNNVLTSITLNLTASSTANVGNITNVTLSTGSSVYYNTSGVSFPLVIPVSATITSQRNYTLNFTIGPTASDNLAVGANITAISSGANVSYSALPYTSGLVTLDSLPPYVIFNNLANSSNLSQNYIYLNVASNDTVSNISTISIYLYNLTSLVNSSVNSSVNIANAVQTINFTGLSEGVYYVNATSNDTYNHLNSTSTFKVILDTTDPAASAACSPSTVYPGNIVTCSCSGTDSTSGINSSATTSSSTITVGGPGTYSYACNVADYSGNTGSASASYYVLGYPGSSLTSGQASKSINGSSNPTPSNPENSSSDNAKPSSGGGQKYSGLTARGWIWAGISALAILAVISAAVFLLKRRR